MPGASASSAIPTPRPTSPSAGRRCGAGLRPAARPSSCCACDGFGETAGADVAEQVLTRDHLPDAIACANDELALGLLLRLRSAGTDVPGQVQVTGWDDVMAARYAGLTTVRQPMRELGATAARLLDDLITGSRPEPRHELLATELVPRGSTRRGPG